jgi:hypothetical protein
MQFGYDAEMVIGATGGRDGTTAGIAAAVALLSAVTGCGAGATQQPPAPLEVERVPDDPRPCAALVSLAGDAVGEEGEEDENHELWDRLWAECGEQLRGEVAQIMERYHAGDCEALVALARHPTRRRSELAFIGYILNELGDTRGRRILFESIPIDDDAFLPPTVNRLAAAEGCHPALCRKGDEAACRPWFGTEAPGRCIRVNYGQTSGCMPSFCQEPHEFLLDALAQEWPGARETVLRAFEESDGYFFGELCYDAIREGDIPPDVWLRLASNEAQRSKIERCLASDGGATIRWRPVEEGRAPARRCGERSSKRRSE